jgi:hypothetical protein
LKRKVVFDKNKLKSDHASEIKERNKQLRPGKQDKQQNMEQTIIERCKKHFEDIELNEDDEIKLTQALKRGKKIWKQNHFAFIKTIDRSLRGIENH